MKTIGILNTSIATQNIGDCIIMDSALNELKEITGNSRTIQFPTHEKLSRISHNIQSCIDFNIACGTNLLHSHMGLIKQWNIGIIDAFKLQPVILLGVGWRSQAKRKPDLYTKWLLRKILTNDYVHSVRDSYTEQQLKSCGINNVINTGCPTIWILNDEHCKRIPTEKGKNAVVTLTDYSKNHELDSALIKFIISHYNQIYFWGQGTQDIEYVTQLGFNEKLIILPPNLETYDSLLSENSLSLDYIGTRLHGGIRALQHHRRSIIIGVDHRANVMGADFNLPVIDRYESSDNIYDMILNMLPTTIKPPFEYIDKWKNQFLE